MWQPNLPKVEIKKGDNNLLWPAFNKFQPAQLQDRLSDDGGIFALNTNKGVLVAKRYIYGNIVSAHKRAIVSAMNQGKRLTMYIQKPDVFYEFDPGEIMKKSEKNERGGSTMLNWSIRLGKRLKTLEDVKYENKPEEN